SQHPCEPKPLIREEPLTARCDSPERPLEALARDTRLCRGDCGSSSARPDASDAALADLCRRTTWLSQRRLEQQLDADGSHAARGSCVGSRGYGQTGEGASKRLVHFARRTRKGSFGRLCTRVATGDTR